MLIANTVLSLFFLFSKILYPHNLASKQSLKNSRHFFPILNWYTTCTMTSRWTKRRKIRSRFKATEFEILEKFEETFTSSNTQGNMATIEHTEYPSVLVESGVSASGPSVVEELPIILDWE